MDASGNPNPKRYWTGSTDSLPGFNWRDKVFLRRAASYTGSDAGIEWYGRLFTPKGRYLSGDVTPAYSCLASEQIEEICEAFDELKIVFLVRDPVQRAWSHFNMNVRKRILRKHQGELSEASLASMFYQPTSIDQLDAFVQRQGFLDRAFATRIYTRWRKVFGARRIHVEFFDHIVSEPDKVRQRVLRFLGQPASGEERSVPVDFNRKKHNLKREMTVEVREWLAEYFESELRDCAELFGGPARDWPARYGYSFHGASPNSNLKYSISRA